MPFAAKWLAILPLDKVQAALDLMRQIDIAMFQHHRQGKPLIITLNRATYDAQIISVIHETYSRHGWKLEIVEQSGALRLTFTEQVLQEKTS